MVGIMQGLKVTQHLSQLISVPMHAEIPLLLQSSFTF